MQRRFVHLVRALLVGLVLVVGLVWSTPAQAQSAADLMKQPGISTSAKPVGSAKDLLNTDGKPVFKNIDSVAKPPTSGVDRLKQVTDSVNKSYDRTKEFDRSPNRLEVEIKIPNKPAKERTKKERFPLRDR